MSDLKILKPGEGCKIPSRIFHIIEQVAIEYGAPIEGILGPRKFRRFAQPRQEAMRRVRALAWGAKGNPPSFPSMARWFRRDVSTVIYACYEAKVYPPQIPVNSALKTIELVSVCDSIAA